MERGHRYSIRCVNCELQDFATGSWLVTPMSRPLLLTLPRSCLLPVSILHYDVLEFLLDYQRQFDFVQSPKSSIHGTR